MDWDATLGQPSMTLITDDQASYCLLERHGSVGEGHLIIAHDRRRQGLVIADAMMVWLFASIDGLKTVTAKTRDRHTRLFLRRLGLRHHHDDGAWSHYAVSRDDYLRHHHARQENLTSMRTRDRVP